MMKKVKVLFLLAAISLAFVGCKKGDKGDTGPAGATGATGATGAAGNANVTDTFYNTGNWTDVTGGFAYEWRYDIIDSSLDLGAAVLVYFYNGGDDWIALPWTFHNRIYFFEVDRAANKITLVYTSPAGNIAVGNPSSTIFRVVTVPLAHRMEHPDLDWTDFKSVKKTLHLRD